MSSCADLTQTTETSIYTTIAPTTTISPVLFACRSVQSALVSVVQTLSDYTQQGATDVEVIMALGDAANAFNSAADDLTGYHQSVFRQAALSVNQIRVAKINGSTPPQAVWDAVDQNFTNIQTLCDGN